MTKPLFDTELVLHDPAYIDETARLFGKVTIREGASVWPYAVFRSETHEIDIGAHSNIQDFVMIHVGVGGGTSVGEYTSVTHHCTLHACRVGNDCLIGINSTIMDGAVIGDGTIVAGHTIVPEDTVIPPNSVVMGQPGRVVKTRDNRSANRKNAMMYYEMALGYAQGKTRVLTNPATLERVFGKVDRAG